MSSNGGFAALLAAQKMKKEMDRGIQERTDAAGAVDESNRSDRAGHDAPASSIESTLRSPDVKVQPQAPKGNPFARKAAAAQPSDSQAQRPTQAPTEGRVPDSDAGAGPSESAESHHAAASQLEPVRPKLAGFRFQPGGPVSVPAGGGGSPDRDAGGAGAGSNRGGGPDSDAGATSVQPVGQASGIDSLASLGDLEVGEVAPVRSQFPDETPATAPTRELPDDLAKDAKQFVDLMDGVYSILDDPELLGNVVKSIMIELKGNPQYGRLIAPDDARLWLKAARDSMGMAKLKKGEAKAKRATGGTRGSKMVDADMLGDLADLGIDLS